jgi:hypothetical protein
VPPGEAVTFFFGGDLGFGPPPPHFDGDREALGVEAACLLHQHCFGVGEWLWSRPAGSGESTDPSPVDAALGVRGGGCGHLGECPGESHLTGGRLFRLAGAVGNVGRGRQVAVWLVAAPPIDLRQQRGVVGLQAAVLEATPLVGAEQVVIRQRRQPDRW